MQSLNRGAFTLKKALLLCLYVAGFRFAAELLFYLFHLSIGFVPSFLFLGIVLFTANGMAKGELRRIIAWRSVPISIFAAVLVMFFGMEIIRSELSNFFQMLLPVPDGFFDGWFYEPENALLDIIASALFPGFTEEILFRGIIARRFYRVYSPRRAILYSAMLFGIFHLNPWQALSAFLGGIFYGWMYFQYRNIWLCMVMHAYHNILVSYMPYPYVDVGNSVFVELWRHPLWFDLLGLLLFGIGLAALIVLSGKSKAEAV